MTAPPSPPFDTSRPITVQDLVWVLFGNPINPQDKGLIGQMRDQVKVLIRLAWALLLTVIAALLTLAANLFLMIRH